ncbi:MAG: stress response translation initiation inhibitor YciH [Candidatus Nanoarchaeia archaeon]|nr:stress response translation initiation inhibitor YciH [Candidatus Nanoarchaeia archaeon]MDD5053989.1 stress response translation initiation inhibitor YciH [Candidatus Nanoarchaeia archaeon]MDD5499783.1 stress response translation initiation inhibitor YciH [Candidatus Nanoarchaeia archaeon]
MDVCSTCGLPKELCVCESMAKEQQKIIISDERSKFKKIKTVIAGINPKEIDLKALTKKLKQKLACGGTVKDETIELQGKHAKKAKELLLTEGFNPESIEIKQ